MADLNIRGKEQIIVGTIINANNVIRKMHEAHIIGDKNNVTNIYHYNMIQLFESITDNEQITNINDIIDINIPEKYKINLKRENYYAYFKKVNNFLNGFELNIQQTLNESLSINNTDNKNIDIFNFKDEVNKIIKELEATNDFEKYSDEILHIKSFIKSPLYVCGFNLSNNLIIQQELFDRFSINQLMAICYDKSNKRLLFIPNGVNANQIICYDIINDLLDYYTEIEQKNTVTAVKLEPKTYLKTIKNLLSNNNIFELYFNVTVLNVTFTDNIYFDKMRKQMNQQQSIVK